MISDKRYFDISIKDKTFWIEEASKLPSSLSLLQRIETVLSQNLKYRNATDAPEDPYSFLSEEELEKVLQEKKQLR